MFVNFYFIIINIFIFISVLIYFFNFNIRNPQDSINTYKYLWKKNYPIPKYLKKTNNNKIFISIASYRDPEIIETVKSLYLNALNPQLLTFAVLEQNHPQDINLSDININISNNSNIKHKIISYKDAKGPTWARYIIQNWIDDENYFMQIDSHTRVIKNWDQILIKMLNTLPNKSILTQYPPEYNINTGIIPKNGKKLRSGLYIEGFSKNDGFSRIQSEYHTSNTHNKPFVSETWAACFSFSSTEIINDAPYDPYLPYLFFGEELDITLRLWTKGWNFYSPNIPIIFTNFSRKNRNTYWIDHDQIKRKEIQLLSNLRLYQKFNFIKDIQKYNTIQLLNKNIKNYTIGKIRTIQQYEHFAGVDFYKKTITKHNLKRILKINRKKQLLLNNLI